MKLIDLLNDIANENTLPTKILLFDEVFVLDEDTKDYKDGDGDWLFEDYNWLNELNAKYKILEITVTYKQSKKIEKLDIDKYTGVLDLVDKINEIIDYLDNKE